MRTRRGTNDREAPAGRRSESSFLAMPVLLVALAMSASCIIARDDAVPGAQRPSNRWRIGFDQTAMSDGTIDFMLSPVSGTPIAVSASVGVATRRGGDMRRLMETADRALYQAKTDGRDRVMVALPG